MALSQGLIISLCFTTFIGLLFFFYIRQKVTTIEEKLSTLMQFIQQETIKQRNLRNMSGGGLSSTGQSNGIRVYSTESNNTGTTSNDVNSNNMIDVSDDSESDTETDSDSDTDVETDTDTDAGSDVGSDTDSDTDNELYTKTIHISSNNLFLDGVEHVPTSTDIETMLDETSKPIEIIELSDDVEHIKNIVINKSCDVNIPVIESDLSDGSSLGSSLEQFPLHVEDIAKHTTLEASVEASVPTEVSDDNVAETNVVDEIPNSNTSSSVKINYAKMLVKDLREIVKNQGLSSNVSKMKKNELIQLLQQ